MRIRKRPNPSSSPSSPAPSLAVPPPALSPDPPRGREGAAERDRNGVDHARGTPRLHSDGDLKIHCTPAPRPSPEPRLGGDGSGVGSWRAGVSASSDPVGRGLSQVLRKNEAIAREEEGMVDADRGWDAQVNSNSSSSSAPLLSAEEQQLSDNSLSEKIKRGGGKPAVNKKPDRKAGSSAKMMASEPSGNNGSFCSRGVSDENDRCEGEAEKRAPGAAAAHGKKRRSPAVLMEGSRCSRVNGRGWRCCQQTLVGYSLCEHHLGKGRLRSVTSVRGQLGTSNAAGKLKIRTTEGSAGAREQKVEIPTDAIVKTEEDEKTKTAPLISRRKKIGIVKARTISSLLDEKNYPALPSSLPPPPPAEAAFMPALDGNETMA